VPTKDELASYWRKVAGPALEHLGRRPLKLVMHRHGTTYFHMGPLPPVPASVRQLRIKKREGGEGVRLWVEDLEGLLGLVELGAVELHPWGATIDDIEHPDILVFDLDPGEGVAWDRVTEAALRIRDMLKAEGLASWPKTSGGKGLHVMVPVDRSLTADEGRVFARDLVGRIAAESPDLYTLAADPAEREGRIFLDYLRNGRGTTAIGAWSPRARPGFPIARPVTWAEVEKGVSPDAFTMAGPANLRVCGAPRPDPRLVRRPPRHPLEPGPQLLRVQLRQPAAAVPAALRARGDEQQPRALDLRDRLFGEAGDGRVALVVAALIANRGAVIFGRPGVGL
jgi:bifunctional non-homologous end joining protein LigD